jgi:hypothetical protein
MQRLAVIIVFVLSFGHMVGCTTINIPIGGVDILHDKFDSVMIESTKIGVNTEVRRANSPRATDRYLIITNIWLLEPISINRVVLLLDGERLTLTGSSEIESVKATTAYVQYAEKAVFYVNADQLRQIASANNVETKVYGRNGVGPENVWEPERIEALRKFVRLFVDGEWDAMTEEERKAASKAEWRLGVPVF